jgi:hypothetical protein
VTEPKQAEVTAHIPVVQYMRPRGLKHEGFIVVPEEFQTDQLKEKLALLVKHGIRITQEDVGCNQVNVCLDDGDHDYKFELFSFDGDYGKKVMQLVLDFDEADYLKAKAHLFGEDEGPDESPLGGPNG